jgi:hypothetical protein
LHIHLLACQHCCSACLSAGVIQHLCLQELKIGDLPSLAAVPDLQHLSSLRQLSIYGCECLAAIPSSLPPSLQQLFLSELRALRSLPLGESSVLPQLQQLTLAACDRVAPLPEAVGDLAALQQLAIIGASGCFCSIFYVWFGWSCVFSCIVWPVHGVVLYVSFVA